MSNCHSRPSLFFGPLVFLIVHAYVLLHFVLLAGKIGAFHSELRMAGEIGRRRRAQLRRQLPSNIFVQSLAGPRDVREGPIGFLLRLVIRISLVAGPIALLVLFQLQFLPYHSEWITNWQRIAVVIDLTLLWILWPRVGRGEVAWLQRSDFERVMVQVWLLVSLLPVLLVFTIATFPGEWLEENLLSMPLVPTTWAAVLSSNEEALPSWATLHELLVAGQVNYITARPQSLWSNVLVLPNFEIGDRAKFDAEGKIAISSDALPLRGRSLEGAVLVYAHLRRADFTGAQLANANLFKADLREAKFGCDVIGVFNWVMPTGKNRICAVLQGARLEGTQLQGARLDGAQLQGARLDGAQLQGASLAGAQMQGASLLQAQLQGISLDSAQLQGARLDFAQLQGASLSFSQLQGTGLVGAQLQGAYLDGAELQGARLVDAQLRGASLQEVFVWRTQPPTSENATGALVDAPVAGPYYGHSCRAEEAASKNRVIAFAPCAWSAAEFAGLKPLIENTVPAGERRLMALAQIAIFNEPPYVEREIWAKAWADLQKSSPSPQLYRQNLVKQLEEIGCRADRSSYVIGGLARQLGYRFRDRGYQSEEMLGPFNYRFPDRLRQAAEVAATFLDETTCPGARGLSAEDKARLQQIIDAAPKPSPAAPKAVGSR